MTSPNRFSTGSKASKALAFLDQLEAAAAPYRYRSSLIVAALFFCISLYLASQGRSMLFFLFFMSFLRCLWEARKLKRLMAIEAQGGSGSTVQEEKGVRNE